MTEKPAADSDKGLPTVALIDGNARYRAEIAAALAQYYQVVDFPDARDAVIGLIARPPAVIIVDENAPPGGGMAGDPKVHAPTLVLWAENDPVLPLAWSDKLGDFFPNLTLRTVPQAGHFMMREKPELVNQAIIEFVLGNGS